MMRASKAAAGVDQIVKRVNEVSNIKPASQSHTHKETSNEEVMMFQDLRKLQPFKTKKGRYHHNFKEMIVSPTSTVNMSELFTCMVRKAQKADCYGRKNPKIKRIFHE